jgi:O-antigen ligase
MLIFAIYASLMSLALGLFTSMTFLALTHIFIFIPALYFIPKTNFKNWNKSAWFLLGLIIAIILSIVLNQDIAVEGYKPIGKIKYYLIALLSIAPYSFYFKNLLEDKKITWLLWAVMSTTTIASLSGMSGVFFGVNPLKGTVRWDDRNYGLAGMLMNYAHNLAFFEIVLLGMIFYRDEVKKYINLNFLYAVFAFNLLGLYTTYTRGAALAFLVAIPFFFFKKNKMKFMIFSFVLLLFGIGAYNIAGKAVIRPASDIERTSQWKAAIVGFKERPVFGLGYLNFEKMSTSLKKKYHIEAEYFGGHAHSNYFEALASTGIVGFVLFLGWQVFWFMEMFKRDDLIARIALPFIVVFVVSGLTQATFTLGANLFLIMSGYAISQVDFKILKD